ncbi:hypothetical protein FOCC_FOCC016636, partial [Frankliniella occidentalis]
MAMQIKPTENRLCSSQERGNENKVKSEAATNDFKCIKYEGSNEIAHVRQNVTNDICFDRNLSPAGPLFSHAVKDASHIAVVETKSSARPEDRMVRSPAPQETSDSLIKMQFFTTMLNEPVFIPGRCQMMFHVKTTAPVDTECYIAPGEAAMERNISPQFLIAYSIVKVSKNRTIPVLCVNPFPYEVEIEAGQPFIQVCALQPDQRAAASAPDHCTAADALSPLAAPSPDNNPAVVVTCLAALPKVPDILESLSGKKYFTTLDLCSAFHTLPLAEDSRDFISFTVPGLGRYRYKRLVMGLRTSSHLFQTYLSQLLRDVPNIFCYQDDLLVKHDRAFQTLKDAMCSDAVMNHFPDPQQQFVLSVDSSNVGVGAVLAQPRDGRRAVIAYYSSMFTAVEGKLSSLEKELYGITKALKHFTPLLLYTCQPFILETDHRPLLFLSSLHDPHSRMLRWALFLQKFNYIIRHVPGATFHGPDGLSRLPISHQPALAVVTRSGRDLNAPRQAPPPPPTATPQHLPNPLICHDPEPDEPIDDSTDFKPNYIPVYWNTTEMIDQQARDPMTGPLVRSLKGHTDPRNPSNKKEAAIPAATLQKYFLDENGLLRARRQYDPIVIPAAVRPYIMLLCHDTPIRGHFAAEQTYLVARRQFYWRNMKVDIQNHVLNCITCNKFQRGSTKSVPMAKGLISTGFMELAAMDIVGPLRPDSSGYTHIFTFIDHWSRLLIAVPLRSITGEAVAQALIAHVFSKYGLPRRILSDNGAQLVKGILAALLAKLGIKQLRTMVYLPSHNAHCERSHKDLIRILATLVDETQSNWGEQVFLAAFCMNSHINKSTNETPFFLSTLRDMHFPTADMFLEQEPLRTVTRHDFVSDLYTEMRSLYRKIIERQEAAAEARRSTFNKKAKPKAIREGMKCFLKVFAPPRHLSKKLYPRYQGPYRILKVTGTAVEIQKIFPADLKDAEVKRAHQNQIKLAPDTLLANGDIPPSILPHWASQDEDVDDPQPAADMALRKGGPIVNAHVPPSSTTQPTLELSDQLDAGAIFVQEQVFHLSLAEWDVMVRLPRVQVFATHLAYLKGNASSAYEHLQSQAIKAELKNLLDTISVTEREMQDFEVAARRHRRQAPEYPYQPCSANSPSDRCAKTAVFLPVYQPPVINKDALYAIRWLATYYRRKEMQIASDLLSNGTYQPAELFPKRWTELVRAHLDKRNTPDHSSATQDLYDPSNPLVTINPLFRPPPTTQNPIEALLRPRPTARILPTTTTTTTQPPVSQTPKNYALDVPTTFDMLPTNAPQTDNPDKYVDPFANDRLLRSILNVEMGRNMSDDTDIQLLNENATSMTPVQISQLPRFIDSGFEWYVSNNKSYLWLNGTCNGLPSTTLASIMCPRTFQKFYASTIKMKFRHVAQPPLPTDSRRKRARRGHNCDRTKAVAGPLPAYIYDRFKYVDHGANDAFFATRENWLRTSLIEGKLCQEINETNDKLNNLARNTHAEIQALNDLLRDMMNIEGARKKKDVPTVTVPDLLSPRYDTNATSRPKRAVLDFIGNIASDIIGVMSARDRASLNAKIDAIATHTDVLTRLEKEQASVLNLALTAIEQHDVVLKNLVKLTKVNVTAMIGQAADFASILRNMQAIVGLIRTEINAFVTAHTMAAREGKLSPKFVEPFNLLKILTSLADHVPKGLSLPVVPTIDSIHYYYNTIKVYPSFSNMHLILHLHVPLVHDNRKFTLYRAVPWPFQPNSSSEMYSYFQPEKEYIALHSDSSMHLLLDSTARQQCGPDNEIGICHPLTETYTN